ncbi:hypothetical protein FSP39_014669 [Pinctada imbricata]|uniref:Uncharacterized protein n=1 Tax=Pinctada imbricata TaxID=66713 RepID=A0AA89C7F2_PINIB|nr:hypothetical protein FSP39_014669 [Pinctada imbricata]
MANNYTVDAFQSSKFVIADFVIIVVYLAFCLATGIWATWRTQRGSISGYFLAGRDMLWFAIGASLFSSNIGSGSFVGLAGSGAASGIAVASYELNGLFCLLLLGWLFVPVYIASGVYTLPEYLRKRFGGQRLQIYMSALALLIYVFTKISVDMYAGTIFIQQAIGWDLYAGVFLLLAISAIYTISGGLKAVIYTDTLQTVIMVVGSIVLMILSFNKIGGIEQIYTKYPNAVPSLTTNSTADCGKPTAEAFHLLRDAVTGDIPWPGNVVGISILSCWYFCSDQVLVQRSLSAKNMHHVKGGSILAAYLKVLPLFTTVFPGMISRILFTDQIACVDPEVCKVVCNNEAGCTNIAYPKLVVELMPDGLRGLMLASMMAALMSSLSSVFNSASTLFTMDIWRKVRPRSSEGELLVVGRVFTLILVAVSVLWIPILQASQGGQLFNYIQAVTGYLSPPVLSLFLLAILWKRTNEHGAFWGLMIGLVTGVIRMGLDFGYGSPGCGEEDTRPSVISKVHFLHFTIILFFLSLFATIIISLATPKISEKHLVRLTWWTRHDLGHREPFPEEEVENKKAAASAKPTVSQDPVPRWKRVVFLICGYEPPTEDKRTDAEKTEQIRLLTHIKEKRKWKIFININAIILMSLTVKYITRRFIMEYDPEIEDTYTKHEDIDGHEMRIHIMDTYDKEDSDPMRYLRWADAFMIVYSITCRLSFDKAQEYLNIICQHAQSVNRNCPMALVGNKIDLERYRQISKSEGNNLATKYDSLFFETTAAEEFEFVEDVFHGVLHEIQRERSDKHMNFQPLFISEEKFHAAQRGRPKSPRVTQERKDERTAPKKNSSSFKLFNKSFKIFN